jgi:hypothetical protein
MEFDLGSLSGLFQAVYRATQNKYAPGCMHDVRSAGSGQGSAIKLPKDVN